VPRGQDEASSPPISAATPAIGSTRRSCPPRPAAAACASMPAAKERPPVSAPTNHTRQRARRAGSIRRSASISSAWFFCGSSRPISARWKAAGIQRERTRRCLASDPSARGRCRSGCNARAPRDAEAGDDGARRAPRVSPSPRRSRGRRSAAASPGSRVVAIRSSRSEAITAGRRRRGRPRTARRFQSAGTVMKQWTRSAPASPSQAPMRRGNSGSSFPYFGISTIGISTSRSRAA